MPPVSPLPPGIAAANRDTLARLVAADPVLVDCVPAEEALGLGDRLVLHAGPPIAWAAMCPRLPGAVVGALRYEGWAATDEDAERLGAAGGVRRVVETGITPLVNTGVAGRRAGTGQVGAGTVRAPLGCFTRALEALARSRGAA